MTKAQTTRIIRTIRRARGEEEAILGNNPEAYFKDLKKDPARALKLLQKAGVYDEGGKLTERYRW